MKRNALITAALLCCAHLGWSMPNQITFQGTLKQKNVPLTATRNMSFSFVDSSGNLIPGTQGIQVANVQVTNGFFAVQLPIDPAVPWDQYTPYIQVQVEGQLLTPNQPVSASLYSTGDVPRGMIGMFAGPCPSGWSAFAPLNSTGSFPRAGATYGAAGGSATHVHSGRTDAASGDIITFRGGSSDPASHPAHTHTFTTNTASSLPPFLTMVFCQKQ